MKGFLDYVPGNSFLHRLNPLTKLVLAFTICVASFISKSHIFIAAIIILNLGISASAGILNRGVMLLKGLVRLSVFIFILQLLFIRDGDVLLELPLNITITDNGIIMAFLVVLRLIAATMPLAILLSITQMNDLSNVLVTKLRIPYKYAFTFTTAMRFIPVFAGEMSGIIEAQISRGVELDTKNVFKKMKLILPLCVPLLITSVKKIEGSAISAEIRGFHLRTKESCYKKYTLMNIDLGVITLSGVLVLLSIAVNKIVL